MIIAAQGGAAARPCTVMAGLDPAIHAVPLGARSQDVDHQNSGLPEFRISEIEVGKCRLRVKPGDDVVHVGYAGCDSASAKDIR